LLKKYCIFLLCTTLLCAQTYQLQFSGNKELSQRELYEALGLYKPLLYEFYKDTPTIQETNISFFIEILQNYYKSKGFFHTEIKTQNNADTITFLIEEKNPLRIVTLHVDSDLDISRLIPFKNGDRFEADIFTQSKKDIAKFYANSGYCQPNIHAKSWLDTKENKAYLLYEIAKAQRCFFSHITLEKSKNIDNEILKSVLSIEEGDPFSYTKIEQAYQELYRYEGISKAFIDTDINSSTHQVALNIKVIPHEKPIRLSSGIGMSSDEGLIGVLGIKHRNFYHDLKSLSVDMRVTQIKQELALGFDIPLVNHNFTGFSFGFENEDFSDFSDQNIVFEYYLKHQRGQHSFKESLLAQRVRTYSSENLTIYPQSTLFILSPKLEWGYDTRNSLLEPSSGSTLSAEIMGSKKSTVSDASYYRFAFGGSKLFNFNENIFAMRTKYSALKLYEGMLPPSYRFYAGGMHSNRGYRFRKLTEYNEAGEALGSYSLLDTTAEYRFGIYGNLRGVVFTDLSYLGNDTSPDFSQEYLSVGIGLRYKTPIGPIAIDLGADVSKPKEQYAIHFHIGELF